MSVHQPRLQWVQGIIAVAVHRKPWGPPSSVGIPFPSKRGEHRWESAWHGSVGRVEGFVKGFGAEGSAMACAAGGFIGFPICSLTGNFGEAKLGSLPILVHLSSDQNFFPPHTSQVG